MTSWFLRTPIHVGPFRRMEYLFCQAKELLLFRNRRCRPGRLATGWHLVANAGATPG
jgi:hypothetical protein